MDHFFPLSDLNCDGVGSLADVDGEIDGVLGVSVLFVRPVVLPPLLDGLTNNGDVVVFNVVVTVMVTVVGKAVFIVGIRLMATVVDVFPSVAGMTVHEPSDSIQCAEIPSVQHQSGIPFPSISYRLRL